MRIRFATGLFTLLTAVCLSVSTAWADDYLAEASTNGVARWPVERVPIKVFIEEGKPEIGYTAELKETLKQAFTDWSSVSSGHLKFEMLPTRDNAQIICDWTNDPKKMMTPKEGGYTIVTPDTKGILHADILILTLPPGGSKTMPPNFAKRVALHEVGHAIGLLGHSSSPNDVMYDTVPPNDQATALSDRDKNTIVSLYSAAPGVLVSKPFDPTKTNVPASAESPALKCVRLNNEAVALLQKNELQAAVAKLEEARGIDPNNQLVNSTLGGVYANLGSITAMLGQFPASVLYFEKAVPALEKGMNKSALLSTLTNYSKILRLMKQEAKANAIDAKLKSLQ